VRLQQRRVPYEGVDGNTACDLLSDVCAGDPAGEFDGTTTCTPSGQSSGSGYCDTQQQCTQSKEIADGIFAVRYDYRYAQCQSLSTGNSTCYCSNNMGSVQFDIEGNADLATCNLTAELCGETDSLELSGPIECALSSQSAQAGYCNAGLDCTQAGEIAGKSVTVHGSLTTYCQVVGDAWSCTCQSGTESATFSMESGATPWDDCTEASTQCQDLVDVQIGKTGGGIGVPLPGGPIPFK